MTTAITCPKCGRYVVSDLAEHIAAWHKALNVGDGVTLHYPQDSYGMVVVTATATTVKVAGMPTNPDWTGGVPARYDGPFPVWSHTYTDEQRAEYLARVLADPEPRLRTFTLRKDGRWYEKGTPMRERMYLSTDGARYHRNHSY